MSAQSLYKLGLITYFQMNREYIAQVLCINKEKPASTCNGQCFLKMKLGLVEEPTEGATRAPLKAQVEILLFIISKNNFKFDRIPTQTETNTSYLFDWLNITLANPFHPPATV